MKPVRPLRPEQLRRTCDPKALKFATTDDISPLSTVIGQQRAVEAIAFGLNVAGPGYHIFVTGLEGTGKTTIVRDLVARHARRRPAAGDWCLVHNFADPFRPRVLHLEAGSGATLAEAMERFVSDLRQRLPRALAGKGYQQRRAAIEKGFQEKAERLMEAIERQAAGLGLGLNRSSEGLMPIVLVDGQPIDRPHFQALPKAEKDRIQRSLQQIRKAIAQADRSANRAGLEMAGALERLRRSTVEGLVSESLASLRQAYDRNPAVSDFLAAVAADIGQHLEGFLVELGAQEAPDAEIEDEDFLRRYRSTYWSTGAVPRAHRWFSNRIPPMPTFSGASSGARPKGPSPPIIPWSSPVALLQANGGYLLLEVESVLTVDLVWEALKRALVNRTLAIEDVGAVGGGPSALRPGPIDLDVKVILLGGWEPFTLLQNYDAKFNKLFRVRADFDYEVARSAARVRQYARFVARVCRESDLRPFTAAAVAAVVEYGQVLTADQRKLSLRFGPIVGLLKEADYWARQDRAPAVDAVHVHKSIAKQRFRHNLSEEKIHESYLDGTILIDVDGEVVGQVNALAVYQLGELSFGRPTRITAEVYAGEAGVLNVEREADLSGSSHDKGVLILAGWLGRTFARRRPLNLSISITFEQSYAGVDGDSASSTELYAVLSSLAEAPIRQGVAATGSVNQKGQIQAIGGVNEKIEGYFEVCRSKGLSGTQGVIIPRSNLANLMLNAEVVAAVAEGRFHVWAVETVEEGIQILTGMPAGQPDAEGRYPAGTLYHRVQQNLSVLARGTEGSAPA